MHLGKFLKQITNIKRNEHLQHSKESAHTTKDFMFFSQVLFNDQLHVHTFSKNLDVRTVT